jgi:hypothetical protein
MRSLITLIITLAAVSLVTGDAWAARRIPLAHSQVAHVCGTMSTGDPGYHSSTDCIKCTGSNCRNYYCDSKTGKCYELFF